MASPALIPSPAGSLHSLLRRSSRWLAAGILCVKSLAADNSATEQNLEFFERRIRPVLAERCYSCHSKTSEKLKGGLLLDSREGLLRGGDTGPALKPGNADASLLIQAIRYGNQDLLMPPKGKLPENQINDLVTWVNEGAHWPADLNAAPGAKPKKEGIDLDKRRASHWSWTPLTRPDVPHATNPSQGLQPVDSFILKRLESAKLKPASEASRATLIRRLYLDLIGLPPNPEAVAAFVQDPDPQAYERLVDSLLASPQFGERWARHWLDLVRYAETLGHEFDYPRHNAWRYRDYVIRALNQDLPYDQFVREHIAGDLLQPARWNKLEGFNESVIATGFYWFGQQVHSPVDIRVHQSDMIDNQIDVLSKTFMGLTVSCARCHDHKFDAITTKDFYSLYGVLSSSRYVQAQITPQVDNPGVFTELTELKSAVKKNTSSLWRSQSTALSLGLEAALEARTNPARAETPAAKKWMTALTNAAFMQPGGLGAAIAGTGTREAKPASPKWRSLMKDLIPSARWNGGNLDAVRSKPGDFVLGAPQHPIARLHTSAGVDTALLSRRVQGGLRTPTFTIQSPWLLIRAAGKDARFNVVIDNFTMLQAPIYGALRQVIDQEQPRDYVIDMSFWVGHRAYVEFNDTTHGDPASAGRGSYGTEGYFQVIDIAAADEPSATPADDAAAAWWLNAKGAGLTTVRNQFETALNGALDQWQTAASAAVADPASLGQATAFLASLNDLGLLDSPTPPISGTPLHAAVESYRQLETRIRPPLFTPAMEDGTPLDEVVFVRGSPRNAGPAAPRKFLDAFDHQGQGFEKPFEKGTGRLELAERILDPRNPFSSRVMANRIWLHLFGRGIVPTPDDFGVLGQPPSHPELLDWLADYFRTEAKWSVKRLIRLLTLSRTYRMSSVAADSKAEEIDPQNLLWHRMPIKRLEAEAIRDSLLALSKDLNLTMAGVSVPTHLTPFMDGRGRPGSSGPLDGQGRRSIYLEVRNNFLAPMMRTFDAPIPFTTVGRRTASNVPAQSLILMNDPFVLEQARHWARRTLERDTGSVEGRIHRLFQEAYGRAATANETAECVRFLSIQAREYGVDLNQQPSELRVWTDLCHAIINGKELIYIP